MNDHYPFELKPLDYSYDALEPHIDAETVRIHHDKHLATYVDNLNKALEPLPKLHNMTLVELLTAPVAMPAAAKTAIHNNAGGVYNHNLYFSLLGPAKDRKPQGILSSAMIEGFGSFESFETAIKEAALGQFGSGYAWLVCGQNGRLSIEKTPNQDTVLKSGKTPLLLVDVWEHAYYLKYQNRRAEYVPNWLKVVDWEKVEGLYANAVGGKKSLFGAKQV